ncbi:MAG TPA: hypothetical protein VM370_03885 [Candidatus Thermoplasmatota archaeon]|nr:hypothetical protein [Candidatus Thermoplasmatota archaeon]
MDGILVLSGAITLLVGFAFLPLVAQFARRPSTDATGRRAMRLYAFWWGCLAFNHAASGVVYTAAGLGWTSLESQVTLAVLNRVVLCASLVGLMTYVLYVATGRDLWKPLAIVYVCYLAITLLLFFASRPDEVLVLGWRTVAQPSVPTPRWGDLLAIVVIVLPPLVGGILFARAARRAATRTARVRGAVVGYMLMAWWVLTVAAGNVATYTSIIQPLNRLAGLILVAAALLAYGAAPRDAASDAQPPPT